MDDELRKAAGVEQGVGKKNCSFNVKRELQPKISLLHVKVLTLIKAKK